MAEENNITIEEEKPSYYAILPANVRYDNRLSQSEKILYSEITALSNKNGECFASNNYFAKLYEVTKTSISNWISNLKKYDYIEVTIRYKNDTKEIANRTIKIKGNVTTKTAQTIDVDPIKENLNTLSKKTSIGYTKKFNDPIKKNFKDNNININNTSINKENKLNKFNLLEKINNLPNLKNNQVILDKIEEWLKYKAERKQSYKETGLNTLLNKINKLVGSYGIEKVCEVIDNSIFNNYSGLFFDKLENEKNQNNKTLAMNENERYIFDNGYLMKNLENGKTEVCCSIKEYLEFHKNDVNKGIINKQMADYLEEQRKYGVTYE